jgi:hypothetical protein
MQLVYDVIVYWNCLVENFEQNLEVTEVQAQSVVIF